MKTRESQLEERITDNVGDFFENHVLQLRLAEPEESSRALEEEGKYLIGNKKNISKKKYNCKNTMWQNFIKNLASRQSQNWLGEEIVTKFA